MIDTAAPETVEQVNTYRIHEVNMDAARALVEKVNRKARRYGLSEYTLLVSEPIESPVFEKSLFHHIDGSVGEQIGVELYYDVALIGEMPQIDGFTFVGVLDYTEEAGVITRPVPGVEIDLSAHRVRENECDHCHKIRNRNETYVLMNTATGETMQVGSTCIQPYMGLTVSGLAWIAGEPFAELDEMREPSESGPRPKPRYNVDAIIRYACGVETVFGFVSKAAAAFDQTPTVSYVWDLIDPPTSAKAREEFEKWARRINWEKADEKAPIVREFAKVIDGSSEYAENMRTLANGETITSRNVGLLVSAVGAYNRDQGEIVKRAVRVPSEWVGEPGAKGPKAKINVSGTISQAFTSENEWGVSTLYIIQGEGVTYKVRIKGVPFETGDAVTGTAKVKAHELYKDDKQTVIWYAKLDKVADSK